MGYTGDGFYRSEDPTNSIKVLKEPYKHAHYSNKTYGWGQGPYALTVA